MRRLRAVWRGRRGAVAVWSIMWVAIFLALGGVAVDITNARRVHNQLQAAADAAALGAAARIPDEDTARALALQLASMNLPASLHGVAISEADVRFGAWDTEAGLFDEGASPAAAVLVKAWQTEATGNPVRTWLLPLVGFDAWNLTATSVAVARMGAGGPPAPALTCAEATIMTTDYLSLGGGNTFLDGVCLHGETGVHAGGDDFFTPDVRVSAADAATVYINSVRTGSATGPEVTYAESRSAQIVPQLGPMFDALWDELWPGNAASYDGDALPDFVRGPDGAARIVRKNQGWWTMQPADVQPNTIYLVNHGMGIAGDVQLHNAVVLARGQIGIGGGSALNYRDVVMFGRGALNFSGDILWGSPDSYCGAGEFGVYLFSLDTVSLGGWGATAGMYGAMVAAPTISPGGSLKNAGGLYFEATKRFQNGGNARIEGCGVPLSDAFDFGIGPATDEPPPLAAVGSYLVR